MVVVVIFAYYLLSRFIVSRVDGTGEALVETSSSTLPTIEMLFVGDIMLDRTVRQTIDNRGFEHLFEEIERIFDGIDIAVGNLEGVISENESESLRDFDILRFTFATTTASSLKALGFSGVSLANNHADDFDAEGLRSTEEHLRRSDIFFFGSPNNDKNISHVESVKEQDICFVGYNQFNSSSISPVIATINTLVPSCDYIIVFAHWGDEYESSENEEQRRLGRAFIDAGADVVIGSHPHVVEPIEIYKSKAIFYSVGNFVFDQDFSLPTRQGLAVRLELGSSTQRFHLIGLEMRDNRLYFPQAGSFEPSEEVILSKLPEDLQVQADVEGVLELPR